MGESTSENLQEPLLSNAQEEEDIAVPVVPVPPAPTGTDAGLVHATPVPGGEPLVAADAEEGTGTSTVNDGHIPREKWRDDFCDCCEPACCHPACCLGCCCPSILVGQIMMRFSLGLTGKQVTPKKAKQAFTIILIVTALNFFFLGTPSAECGETLSKGYGTCSPFALFAFVFANLWALYIIFLIVRARMYIRKRYNIKAECCGELEDIALSYCCTCCTVSQMARHTADYDKECGKFCTNTGLPHDSPALV